MAKLPVFLFAFLTFLLFFVYWKPKRLEVVSVWVVNSTTSFGDDDVGFSYEILPKRDTNCNEKWPDIELFLTTPASRDGESELYHWFLPSLALFWPASQLIKLMIVTDIEQQGAPLFVQRIATAAQNIIPEIQVRSVLTSRAFPCPGWDKSQWLKMWADNFTNATYVGFVDTDSVFVTRVSSGDLFIEGKPVVRPIYGKPRTGWDGQWFRVPLRTYRYTGYREPFNCMTYFPVIIKTVHLKFIREVIMRQLQANSFDDAFGNFWQHRFYSEYNMMCTILWWNFRDDYYWVISETEPGWQGDAPYGQVADLLDAQITPDLLTRTRPHLTVHWTYVPYVRQPDALHNAFRKGYCYSLTENERHPDCCSVYDRRKNVNDLEFVFEFDNFSSRPIALDAHLTRIAANEQCPHDWRSKAVGRILPECK